MTSSPSTEGHVGRHGLAVMNGPQGGALDWLSVDWQQVEHDVRRLRQRIFAASQAGDLVKVRDLQKLMLRSRANALLSVRRVTELNAGRNTAGVDGNVVVTAPGKAFLADRVQHHLEPLEPKAVKRVYIAKANGKRRPLGIPVIADRALQAQVVNALEPEWEARFEPKSYGFRPGRGCHDAIEVIHKTAKGKHSKRQWILDADLAAAFDRIDHAYLLGALGGFPARELIEGWLKAGVIENGRFAPTEEGTPQGGVVSPVLLNVALHGMEEAAGVCYHQAGVHAGRTVAGSAVVVRYADDLIAMCHSRDQAEQVKARLAAWLAPRGLAFNEDKTHIVHLDDGFDFLGFNVRRYRAEAADQTIPSGPQAAPGTAGRGDEGPARGQRRRGASTTEPDHSGLVGLLPDGSVHPGIRRAGPLHVAAHLQVGHPQPPEQTEATGSSPTTSASSTSPGVTGGSSVTVTAAPTYSSTPGPASSDTKWSQAGRHPTTQA